MIEFCGGFELVHARQWEEVVFGGAFLAVLKEIFGTEGEDGARR